MLYLSKSDGQAIPVWENWTTVPLAAFNRPENVSTVCKARDTSASYSVSLCARTVEEAIGNQPAWIVDGPVVPEVVKAGRALERGAVRDLRVGEGLAVELAGIDALHVQTMVLVEVSQSVVHEDGRVREGPLGHVKLKLTKDSTFRGGHIDASPKKVTVAARRCEDVEWGVCEAPRVVDRDFIHLDQMVQRMAQGE
jgi:hypothetical protein